MKKPEVSRDTMIPKLTHLMSQSTPTSSCSLVPLTGLALGEMAKNLSKTQAEDEEPETQSAF